MRTKIKTNGTVERRKARIVTERFSQEQDVDFYETLAPVARIISIKIILGLAAEYNLEVHQFDFFSAYLNGNLEETIYMEVPEDLASVLKGNYQEQDFKNKVCCLNKAIYGLKQSSRQWYKKLDLMLNDLNLKPLDANACVYFHKNGDKITLVSIYVDDLILASNDEKKIDELKQNLANSFEMKDLGHLHYCLGIKFNQDKKNGTFHMSQNNCTQEVLKRFNLENCKPIATSMNAAIKLSKKMCPNTEEEKYRMKQFPYRNLVGSLMYLATSTRPDISHAVSIGRLANVF